LDRSSDHPGWGDDGEEYTEKAKKKKKGEWLLILLLYSEWIIV
jgi:hypothetical protein